MARPRKNTVEVPGAENSSAPAAITTTETTTTPAAALAETPAAAAVLTTTAPAAPTADTTAPAFDMATAGAADILEHFRGYGFADPLGHQLDTCLPFLQLLERATAEPEPDSTSSVQTPAQAAPVATSAVISAEPIRTSTTGPVLTEHGWLIR